jgi:alanine racemase
MTKADARLAPAIAGNPASPAGRARFFRPTWAEISLTAFQDNLRETARVLGPSVRMIVVLKANGYGHGALALAKSAADLRGVPLWGFGLSSVEEGLALREAGIRQPLLILGSLYPFDSFEAALQSDLTPTVASRRAALALGRIAAALKRRVRVHLKVDTGMGRIGISPEAAGETLQAIEEGGLQLEGVYTHLARADSRAKTRTQMKEFDRVAALVRRRGLSPMMHAANSAAVFLYPEWHHQAVRPGLALYGVRPAGVRPSRVALRPVLTWKTRIVFLKKARPGIAVSYGSTFRTKRTSWLATLPVGYADGYRRSFSNRGQVLVKGRRCPVVGRVTMDQTVVDVTDVPHVEVGEEVVLLGEQAGNRVLAEDMARWADTIPYEILCGISGRVPRVTL